MYRYHAVSYLILNIVTIGLTGFEEVRTSEFIDALIRVRIKRPWI